MATIEQLNPEQVPDADPEPQYLSLTEAGPMLDALSSETAQSIVVELSAEPATPAAVADRIGTSVQNVSYHLTRLEDAGLVTVTGTRYSEKGCEMKVYAPAVTSLVITGDDPDPGERE